MIRGKSAVVCVFLCVCRLVNNHLFSVQSMCGAQLNVSPGAPGLFHLLISGSKGQVETAKSLVSQVLGQQII